jgi:actin-like ATPase involved in cell morphogenesis/Tfp pilus assembly protein PilZ
VRWWRVFIDKLTGRSPDDAAPVGPRRRKAVRYDYEVKLQARCSSWPRFVELFTGDVSSGGLYVPSDQQARVGEEVEVTLELPDGATLPLTGTVVNVIDATVAARLGKRPGLGIRIDLPEGEGRGQFERLLEAARAAQPQPPRPEPAHEHGQPAITATGSVRLSAVHQAIADGTLASPTAAPAPAEAPAPAPPAVPPPTPPPRPTPAPMRRGAPRPGPIVGIDLGTTYTSVAAVQGKKVTILGRPDGSRSTPSVIAFPDRNTVIVGAEARERIATDPAHTVSSPKRVLGRPFDEPEVQTFISQVPYRTYAGPDGTTVVEVWKQPYAVPQLISFLLKDAMELASGHLGEPIEQAVVSVPISFDEERIDFLRRAGQMAGLEVISVIDEPSAAALANRFDAGFGGVVGVYDFGGGTFDFSVVDVSQGDFRVMATAGDTWLGGDDFDSVLAEAAANQFWRQHKVDLRRQAVEWQKLIFACERAKRGLSNADTSLITVPNVLRTADGMVDLSLTIDRATFKRAANPIIQRSLDTCDEALGLLEMKPGDLSTVYLSGGTTYIPAVREALASHFGVPVRTGVPPEHAVCLGAAIHAAQLQFQRSTTLDSRD